MLDLAAEFEAVISALAEHAIEYAVCGGLAMAIHGYPRATVDIDLLIRPQDENRVYAAVEPLGYTFRAKPMHFAKGAMEIRRVSKIDPAGDTLMLDLLLVTPSYEDVWMGREIVESDFGSIGALKAEMSRAAVTLRIRRVSQLRELCLRLARAGSVLRTKKESTTHEIRPSPRR